MCAQQIDMSGKRYSSIVAICCVGKSTSGDMKWKFKCDCGTQFEANGYYARSGKITTCPKCAAERTRVASVKHGMSGTAEFSTWTDIQSRCYNKNMGAFSNYGGRGIKVCERWLESFENFLLDMGKRPSKNHSIDRINNDGDYEPENCRWATKIEQANNKRSNIKIDINGVTKSICEWSIQSGISNTAIYQRYKSGLTGEALIARNKNDGCITLNGITDTYSGWSKRTGIKKSTISMRIKKYGWTTEKALTQGALF